MTLRRQKNDISFAENSHLRYPVSDACTPQIEVDISIQTIEDKTILVIGTYYCIPITIAVIVLFFLKTSRDERGRAIIGKASIISTIVFVILVNVFAKLSMRTSMDFYSMANGVQWIYNIVLTIQVVAILIYKKIE